MAMEHVPTLREAISQALVGQEPLSFSKIAGRVSRPVGQVRRVVLRMEASGQAHTVPGAFGRVWRAGPRPASGGATGPLTEERGTPSTGTRTYERQDGRGIAPAGPADALACEKCGRTFGPEDPGASVFPAYCESCDHCNECGKDTWPELSWFAAEDGRFVEGPLCWECYHNVAITTDFDSCEVCRHPLLGDGSASAEPIGRGVAHPACREKWFEDHGLDPNVPEPPEPRLKLFGDLLTELNEGIRSWTHLDAKQLDDLLFCVDHVLANVPRVGPR